MQIVIDIPEESYIALMEIKEVLQRSAGFEKFIVNGTPLPKGHKRLIEDNFEVGPVFDEEGNRVGYQYVTQAELNNALTIIEADKEVEHDAGRSDKAL